MMRFVDDKNVPTCCQCLLSSLFVLYEQADAAQNELVVEEWILMRIDVLNRLASLFIEDMEPEIEAAKQFNEPLVDQRLRHENQHTFRPAGENEPMKNKTSFDRFAEAHFIGEQDSRRESSGDFRSNEELVRDQIDARSNEATHLRF